MTAHEVREHFSVIVVVALSVNVKPNWNVQLNSNETNATYVQCDFNVQLRLRAEFPIRIVGHWL